MKAMILAAGYGTRLRPLTHLVPKPLFPVANKPLVGYAVESLRAAGISELVVNLHHLPDALEEMLADAYPELTLHFSLEHAILGTGGGIRRVRSILDGADDFLVVNGDTFQSPPWDALIHARRDRSAVAALALRHPPAGDRFTAVWLDDGRVTGFGDGSGEALMFSGAHAISPRIFERMPDEDEFGIVESVYRMLAGEGALAGVVDDGPWFDVGTPRRYLAANAALRGSGSLVDPTARVTGKVERSVVGARTTVEGELDECVVWEDCFVGPGVRLRGCIVGHGVELHEGVLLENAMVCCDDVAISRDDRYRFAGGIVIAPFD